MEAGILFVLYVLSILHNSVLDENLALSYPAR